MYLNCKLMLILLTTTLLQVQAQQRTLRGTVSDTTGAPLEGVSVAIKGTSLGASTNTQGHYELQDVSDNGIVMFSMVGFEPLELQVGTRSTIDATLHATHSTMDEVVVIGYGTQKKSDLTGSVSSVPIEEITKVSERSLATALQGKAAGVIVSRSEGKPGSGSSIQIRGAGTIGNSTPLWVIDGVPMAPGNYFNMNDAESIEILKDASAAAIYGARAAHGVILVTTKRGAAQDKVTVNLGTQVGWREAVSLPKMLNTLQFVETGTKSREAAGQTPESAWDNPASLPSTNWADELYAGNGLEQTYNLSVSGGNERSKFYVSGAYDRENGVMINNWFERFAVRANSDFKIGKMLKIGESILVSRSRNNPTDNDTRDLERIYRSIPIMPVYDASNSFGGWGRGPTYFNGGNPVAQEWQSHILSTNTRINGNVYAELEPLPGLTLRGSFGANILAGRTQNFQEAFDYGTQGDPINSLTHASDDVEEYNTNVVLTYANTLGKHDFSAMAGYERFQSDGTAFSAKALDFPVDVSYSFALASGEVDIVNRNTLGMYRLASVFGRVNYTYSGKYLLTANVRRDGSSRFGPENRYGVFPSFSAGWRMIEEPFMQNIPVLSDLKLRAGWGILGSDRIADFIYSRTYNNIRSSYVFDATGVDGGTRSRGFYLSRFPNEEVKWEEVRQTNIGIDAGFLDGSITLTADYYIKKTTDMLFNVQLPLTSGIAAANVGPSSSPINVGQVSNRGFELALTYRKDFNDWNLNVTGNTSFNKNEIEQLNADDFLTGGAGGAAMSGYNLTITETGHPMSMYWGWIADGIFQSDEEINALNSQSPTGNYQEEGTAAGDLKYRDMNGDGVITNDDRVHIGNPWPKMTYGLNVNVGYRGWDLSLFLQGVQGVELFNLNKAYSRTLYSDYNSTTDVYEAWTPENPTEHPRLIATDPNGNFRKPSSYFVEDGSYLKLRNVQLGYTLPQPLMQRVGMTNTRVFVSAQNVLTLTKYSGLDPELAGGNTARGIDGQDQYPQTRLFSAGVQIGF
ncbi:SusC/RagA family TonB-linked outer membrane protein [Parapedobacter tibetensis]|uniref:SusC/RagA family TonB-linked outer membrane protein n=1 Tax=Parapedobacter tibetensis TaxID=2972951 RepID=UPI00214D7805|nr:TonB-dependent receptor [Parapedobacter tibetensis]